VPLSVEVPQLPRGAQPAGLRLLLTRMWQSHGFRGGLTLALATLVLNGCAYLYNVACIRYLGARAYGDLAALLALGALVALPLGSVQIVLAREVAQLGSPARAAWLLRRVTTRAAVVGISLFAFALLLLVPIQNLLNVDSRLAVVAGLSSIVLWVVVAGLYGVLQGELRFGTLSVTYAASGVARLAFVVPALLLGFGVVGALVVNTLAGVLAVALAAIALRDLWRIHEPADEVHLDRRQVTVMVGGSLAFASLTNVDVILAAYYLPDDVAGVYAAAALVGKAVLFLPTAIVTVLLPKAAVRTAAGFSPHKILLASAAVTLGLTLSATVVLALVPETLLVRAFGGDFRDSTALLGWFGLAMTAAALVSVYLSVYFAERDSRFPVLVGAAALAQIVGVALWHPSAESIVLVTMICCVAVLAIHEFAFPYGLWRLLRTRTERAAASNGVADRDPEARATQP
jgi:O-antigen/teichoic acid export membrane protein